MEDKLTGEILKDGRIVPGLLLSAIAVVALALSLYLLGVGETAAGAAFGGVFVLLGAAGVLAVIGEHRRVARQQRKWRAEHPQAERPRAQ